MKTNLQWQKPDQWLLRDAVGGSWRGRSDYKDHEEAFGVMVYYPDCNDGFMGA